MPRWLRWCHKRAKRARGRLVASALNASIGFGGPSRLAGDVRRRHAGARVVLYKQGVLRLVDGDRYLRYARRPSARARLGREVDAWRRLREQGLDEFLPRSMVLEPLAGGLLLTSERLDPIDVRDQVAVTLPILRALVRAARPITHPTPPATIAAGLRVASQVFGGVLPRTLVDEAAIRAAFARPVLTGASHGDLHHRNVMRDADGRPVLIDLKSCTFDGVLAFDLLALACKYLGARNDRNVIDNAFLLHRRGWEVEALAPVLAMVDLPRAAWGPLFALHTLGRLALRRPGMATPGPVAARLLRRALSRGWQRADGSPAGPAPCASAPGGGGTGR